jgi:hypothetical protein
MLCKMLWRVLPMSDFGQTGTKTVGFIGSVKGEGVSCEHERERTRRPLRSD